MAKRQGIIRMTATWTPGATALESIFAEMAPNVHISSAARINFTAEVPFDEKVLDTFASAQRHVTAFEERMRAAGDLHKFDTRITSTDAADAPPPLVERDGDTEATA